MRFSHMLAIAMAVGSTTAVAISQDSGTPHKLEIAARSGRRVRVIPGSITLREKRDEDEVEQLAEGLEQPSRRELTHENIARRYAASGDSSNAMSLTQIRGRAESKPPSDGAFARFMQSISPFAKAEHRRHVEPLEPEGDSKTTPSHTEHQKPKTDPEHQKPKLD
ncbi:hypothetical protein BC835DRAFT_193593 [Cytidiella melzeri]|nr:hypothetical protein BC835DRAFT_193593 [Cytidiella melzeri]